MRLDIEFALNYATGVNLFSYNLHNTYLQGDGFSFQGFNDISNASTITSTERDNRYRQLGIFAQVEGSWKNTVFLTASIRQDYDSRLLAPGKVFKAEDIGFLYPSLSGSFAFTEVLPESDILSFGKLRLSWAQVGVPPPVPYSTGIVYETDRVGDGWGPGISWPIGSITSFEKDNELGNPNLKPEVSTGTQVPRRWNYSFNEYLFNSNAPDQKQGVLFDRVDWDAN